MPPLERVSRMENPRDLTDRESFGRMSRVDPMASESRDRLSELYHAALERPPEAGHAFVREVCAEATTLSARSWSRSSATRPPRPRSSRRQPPGHSRDGHRSKWCHRPAAGALHRDLSTRRRRHGRGLPGAGRRLNRDVAIKILPEHFTSDPERRARFAREARLLATLNHPHIGAI
jgi:hypothetical protein